MTKTTYGIPPPSNSAISPNSPLQSGESVASSVVTGAKTLTYTQGSGSSTSTITTTIQYTSTESETVYASNGAVLPSQTGTPENSPQGAGASISPENGGTPNSPQSQGGTGGITTTVQYTSTTTVYDQASGFAGASANSAAGNCAAPVTVTVTGPEETVTVVGTDLILFTTRS